MSKPDSMPVPEAERPSQDKRSRNDESAQQQPLSGSKKTKKKNHTSHLNPEGS
ncbi:small acid-soluble spore protein P [Paenibacillus sp. KS-LC4]|uniref:small acid-soluble spore protein P n=1 Tax=Paenibacillus sp. KS-LC4 TaxID=2979727 RepID=UPI0030D35165